MHSGVPMPISDPATEGVSLLVLLLCLSVRLHVGASHALMMPGILAKRTSHVFFFFSFFFFIFVFFFCLSLSYHSC